MADLMELQKQSQSLMKTVTLSDFILLSHKKTQVTLIKLPKETKPQIHALTYFVSGLVYRMDDTTKAKAFFSEGIKLLNGIFLLEEYGMLLLFP
jgi:hypothetical protein